MLTYPERKTYRYQIPTVYGDVFLRFKQATAKETKEYINIVNAVEEDPELFHEIMSYRKEFFNAHCVEVKNNRRAMKYEVKNLARSGFVMGLYEEIQWKYHKSYTSIYGDREIPVMRFKNGDNWEKQRSGILNRNEKNISEYTGTPIDRIYDTYTIEQLGYFQDCITWDYLEHFDEGKALNDRIKIDLNMGLDNDQQKILEYIKQHSTNKQSSNGTGRENQS